MGCMCMGVARSGGRGAEPPKSGGRRRCGGSSGGRPHHPRGCGGSGGSVPSQRYERSVAPPPVLLQLRVALRDGPREVAREDVDDVEVAALGGVVERRLAVAVGGPGVGSSLE